MRIVDRETFLALPAGTLFAKYAPCLFGAVQIKGATVAGDFFAQQLTEITAVSDAARWAALDAAVEDGAAVSFELHCESRDGCFDGAELFAVWEPTDLTSLIARLQEALALSIGGAVL